MERAEYCDEYGIPKPPYTKVSVDHQICSHPDMGGISNGPWIPRNVIDVAGLVYCPIPKWCPTWDRRWWRAIRKRK